MSKNSIIDNQQDNYQRLYPAQGSITRHSWEFTGREGLKETYIVGCDPCTSGGDVKIGLIILDKEGNRYYYSNDR